MSDTIISHKNVTNDEKALDSDPDEEIQVEINQSMTKKKAAKLKSSSKLSVNNSEDYDNETACNKFPIPKNILRINSKSSSNS